MNIDQELLRETFRLARSGMRAGGGPFGALVARDGMVIATGMNESRPRNDPTAHAEIMAIRAAGAALGRRTLSDCVLYSSCEPCPMCLAACYWAELPLVIYSCNAADAAAIGYQDSNILEEIRRDPTDRQIRLSAALRLEGLQVFEEWRILQSTGTRQL